MADIRFLVSGSSAPFIARLCNTGSGTAICRMAIDYSGTCCNSCNIFSNLYPNSSYTISVGDAIGNCATITCTTPVQVGTTTLAAKNFSLAGTAYSPAPYTCYMTDSLVVSPTLSTGECVCLCFTGGTYRGHGSNSSVSVACKTCGTSSWVTLGTIMDNTPGTIPAFKLRNGDSVCYNLTVSPPSGVFDPGLAISARANLCLCLVSAPVGFNIGTCTNTYKCVSMLYTPLTTTTSATPVPNITVYLGGVTDNSTNPAYHYLCGHICTSPALQSGQSFRLCFTTNARSYTADSLAKPVSACAFLKCTTTTSCCNFSCSNMGALQVGDCSANGYCYINVTSSNINNLTLCVITRSNLANDSIDYLNCGTLCFNTISNTVGGNYVLSSTSKCMSACSTSSGTVTPLRTRPTLPTQL